MGYTMRTERYRYTEWVGWNGTALAPLWDTVVSAPRVEAMCTHAHASHVYMSICLIVPSPSLPLPHQVARDNHMYTYSSDDACAPQCMHAFTGGEGAL